MSLGSGSRLCVSVFGLQAFSRSFLSALQVSPQHHPSARPAFSAPAGHRILHFCSAPGDAPTYAPASVPAYFAAVALRAVPASRSFALCAGSRGTLFLRVPFLFGLRLSLCLSFCFCLSSRFLPEARAVAFRTGRLVGNSRLLRLFCLLRRLLRHHNSIELRSFRILPV